jgi:hypothetical protein
VTRRQHRHLARGIDAWIDAELDASAAAAVDAHVRDCWHCSSAVELTRLLKRSLRARRQREPSGVAVARLRRFAAGLDRDG